MNSPFAHEIVGLNKFLSKNSKHLRLSFDYNPFKANNFKIPKIATITVKIILKAFKQASETTSKPT